MHGRQVFGGVFVEVSTRKSCPVNTIFSRCRADDKNGISDALSRCRNGFAHFHDAGGHGVDQNIVVVAVIKVHFTAHRRHAKTVPVMAYPLSNALHEMPHVCAFEIAKTKGIECRNRSCAHRKNVAVNPAHARCCALKWLNCGRVIVRFYLKGARQTIANVHQTRIFFSRTDEQTPAVTGQFFEIRN